VPAEAGKERMAARRDPGPPWNGRTAEPALHAPSFGRSFA
jgi:hypothetical protein